MLRRFVSVAVVIVVARCASTSTHRTATGPKPVNSTTTSVNPTTSVQTTATSPKPVNSKEAADINQVSATVPNVLVSLGEAEKNPTQDAVNALAQSAQQAHEPAARTVARGR